MHEQQHDFVGFLSQVKIGNAIPDFEFEIFQNDDVRKVKFSQYKEKWLIVFFYPGDFTFVCPTELEELAAAYPELQKLNTEVISMSGDTVFVHKAWHDTSPAIQKISFPMGSDPSGKISIAFGTYIEHGGKTHVPDEGQPLRGTFIIDPDGILRAMEIHDNSIGRSAAELLRKVQAAQYVMSHGGQVCPASWTPGADTLKPGMDLVGKI
jgi:peroxiredoxin (alkyl hydroperoxide reductase subunit C)